MAPFKVAQNRKWTGRSIFGQLILRTPAPNFVKGVLRLFEDCATFMLNIKGIYNKDIDKIDGQTLTLETYETLSHLVMSLVILEKSIHNRNWCLPRLKL